MKLKVSHSGLYLSLNDQGQAIQSRTPTEWIFLSCSSNDNVNNPISSGCYVRIVLKSEPTKCLQPSHEDLRDDCEIYLRAVTDNDSQKWRFANPNRHDYCIIENHNERREPTGRYVIRKSCIDVCGERLNEGAMTITYHVKNSRNDTNQRWKIEA